MKKKTTVTVMVLLLCLSMMLAGCRSRNDADMDDHYNDNSVGEDIIDGMEDAGDDIKDGVKDILDGNDTNNHDGIINHN